MADFQKKRDGKLGNSLRAVRRDVAYRNAAVFGRVNVYNIVTCCQYADELQVRAGVDCLLCDRRFIRINSVGVANSFDGLVLIGKRCSVIYRELTERFQDLPMKGRRDFLYNRLVLQFSYKSPQLRKSPGSVNNTFRIGHDNVLILVAPWLDLK